LEDIGYVKLKLDELLKKNNMSRTKLSREAEIQYKQIIKYCKNDIQGITFETIAKLCHSLNCEVEDLLEYVKN